MGWEEDAHRLLDSKPPTSEDVAPSFPSKSKRSWEDDARELLAAPPETRPLKNTGAAPVEQIGAGESFLRHASNAVSSNFVNPISAKISSAISGQPYQDALKGINESDAAAEAQHPTAATAGSVVGTGLQLAAPVGRLAEGASVGARALHAGAIGAGYGALGGAGEALSEGGGAGDALASAGKGAVVGGATGAALGYGVGKLFRSAPERVEQRIVSNIARGEAGGAAKTKLATNLVERAGEDGENLLPVIKETGLEKTLATQAAAHPEKALKRVQAVLNENEEKVLSPVYKAIDKGGTGPESVEMQSNLLDKAAKLRAEGRPEIAEGIERYQQFIGRNYADGVQLSGSVLRKLRGSVGAGAFQNLADENTPLGVQTKREIYSVYAHTIEGAAQKTPGVDVAALKAGNERASQLLSVQVALADRAAKAATGASTLPMAIAAGGHKLALAGIAGHALMSGNMGELGALAASEAGHQVVKRIPQMARHADFAASELERAARGGSAAAQGIRGAMEYGAARTVAPAIASRVGGLVDPPMTQEEADRELARRLQAQRGSDSAVTRLSPAEEHGYQAWKSTLPQRLQYEGDYDLRGFYKKNPSFSVDDPEQHMTDEFKLPNHPTFSNESRYYNDKTKHLGGHWEGDVYIPNDPRFKKRVDESPGASP